MSTSSSSSSGIGISGVLGIVFIMLKLVGVINWSWWWVLCPFWIPLAVVAAIIATVLIVSGVVLAGSWMFGR